MLSEGVLVALIITVPSTISASGAFVIASLQQRLAMQQKKTADKLESVKKTAEATHTLSNSALGALLQGGVDDAKEKAVLCHRLAEIAKAAGGDASGDIAAAVAADLKVEQRIKLLQAHLIQQAKVDADQANAATKD